MEGISRRVALFFHLHFYRLLGNNRRGFSPGSLQPRGSSLQQVIPHNSPYNKKHVLILALVRDRARIHDSLYFATAGGILVGLKKKTNANYFSPPIPLRCPKYEPPVGTPINTTLSRTDSWRNRWEVAIVHATDRAQDQLDKNSEPYDTLTTLPAVARER